jgi:hypothetical protein
MVLQYVSKLLFDKDKNIYMHQMILPFCSGRKMEGLGMKKAPTFLFIEFQYL